MNRELMKLLVEAGDKRKTAATTLSVAAIEMAKYAEALKSASKAYATAASQMVTAYHAAHEMTDDELKRFKKLDDHIEDTVAALKKQTGYAVLNATEMTELASSLSKDIPLDRIPPEPPDRPLVKGPPIPKPNFSPEEWGLEKKPGVSTVAMELNKAGWKVIDKLDDELPYMKGDAKGIDKAMSAVFEKYLKPLLKQYGADYSAKDSTGRLILFQQVMGKMNDWARKLTGDPSLKWTWKPSAKPPEPKYEPKSKYEPREPEKLTWKTAWKK